MIPKFRLLLSLSLLPALSPLVSGQGPAPSYYYQVSTELPWAECTIYFDGGSRQKVGFLPVISSKVAPFGTNKYSQDIDLDGKIVFVGDGISLDGEPDCYHGVDVAGKVVMFVYDFPGEASTGSETAVGLEARIAGALDHGVSGIVLVSYQQTSPFLTVRDPSLRDRPEVPIITINRSSAERILSSSYYNHQQAFENWESGKIPESRELLPKLRLRVAGRFEKVETDNFEFRFRGGEIPEARIAELAEVNEKSLDFLFERFEALDPKWTKAFSVYFRDFDSKLFYTHHWGFGLSSPEGVFMVYDGKTPDLRLAVHENTHTLMRRNWGGADSFLDEGIAKYIEALATDADKNHRDTLAFSRDGALYPLEKMITFDIGSNEEEARVAYPASGSFVGFLVSERGLPAFIEKWEGKCWEEVYGKSLAELERDWIAWLEKRYTPDR
jgi:hypothetical protein